MGHPFDKEEQGRLINSFASACKDVGLKITHQRTEIYRTLVEQPDHPTAEIIHKRLLPQLPSISLDTVYRTLATLEEHRLVTRIQTSESQARFEAVYAPHHHLICNQCKSVVDFQWPAMEQLPIPDELANWGRVSSCTVVMYGRCNDCSHA